MENLADVAFLGGAAAALPAFGDRQVPDPDSEDGAGAITVPGMFPSLADDLLGQGTFDKGGGRFTTLAAGASSLGKEMSAAWDTCRQRLLPPLQRAGDAGGSSLSDAVQRKLEAQLVSHAGQVARGTKYRRRQEGRAAVVSAPGASAEPQAPRLLFHHDTPGESALGYDALPPAARLQHVLMEEVETAEAEALVLDSMAVKAPPRGGWHDPANAADLAAYTAAVAFESSCAIARVQLVAWPCKEFVLDNSQFQTMVSAHLGLLPPMLQPLVGKPICALRADGSGWRELGLVDCRGPTSLLAACFTGDANYTPRHDDFRDRVHTELRRAGFTAMRECSHVVLAGMSAGLRALLDTATLHTPPGPAATQCGPRARQVAPLKESERLM
jgi:hypothetical protein